MRYGADVNSTEPGKADYWCPLHSATKEKNVPVMCCLISHGADVEMIFLGESLQQSEVLLI